MSEHASEVTPESILTGLEAQWQRAGRFVDTIDPVAALKTYDRLIDLLRPRLASLRVAAGLPQDPPAWASWRAREDHRYRNLPAPSDRVFTYWDKPVHTAPPLVQACIAQLRTVYPALRVLDGASVRELITVPQRVEQLLEKERPAHFSDYIRTRLLEVHGGIWVDATAWVGRSLDEELEGKYLRSGTVFPRWTRRAIANWFIASHPGSPLIAMQRMALETWWDENDDLPEYFLYHRVFEVLQALVPELRGQWSATPFLSAADAHLLQLEMMQPWRPQTLETIVSIAPLQKLSYKYDTVPEGSVLEHLTRDYLG
ncbi:MULTISPECIES: capsular polysaccharide synthesis protein [unclassified Microbacterium]|uniref:capsular polysaccharide synthesis protein n=1 Tax=unclassified Microbacterium TaxID=2609290 RepID=UPI0012FBF4D8|nr:capsular polysaccharide synthesis protein [Microbacterium sp. MAH-37]